MAPAPMPPEPVARYDPALLASLPPLHTVPSPGRLEAAVSGLRHQLQDSVASLSALSALSSLGALSCLQPALEPTAAVAAALVEAAAQQPRPATPAAHGADGGGGDGRAGGAGGTAGGGGEVVILTHQAVEQLVVGTARASIAVALDAWLRQTGGLQWTLGVAAHPDGAGGSSSAGGDVGTGCDAGGEGGGGGGGGDDDGTGPCAEAGRAGAGDEGLGGVEEVGSRDGGSATDAASDQGGMAAGAEGSPGDAGGIAPERSGGSSGSGSRGGDWQYLELYPTRVLTAAEWEAEQRGAAAGVPPPAHPTGREGAEVGAEGAGPSSGTRWYRFEAAVPGSHSSAMPGGTSSGLARPPNPGAAQRPAGEGQDPPMAGAGTDGGRGTESEGSGGPLLRPPAYSASRQATSASRDEMRLGSGSSTEHGMAGSDTSGGISAGDSASQVEALSGRTDGEAEGGRVAFGGRRSTSGSNSAPSFQGTEVPQSSSTSGASGDDGPQPAPKAVDAAAAAGNQLLAPMPHLPPAPRGLERRGGSASAAFRGTSVSDADGSDADGSDDAVTVEVAPPDAEGRQRPPSFRSRPPAGAAGSISGGDVETREAAPLGEEASERSLGTSFSFTGLPLPAELVTPRGVVAAGSGGGSTSGGGGGRGGTLPLLRPQSRSAAEGGESRFGGLPPL
ncbi:hypothetical protein GPECTOR_71g540 [Gonium pectorale]|uniref:Uncharacterized protein n=1 Tax=Gonium pectorale TaxID=33097 RepID=A0A150G2S6_GONPE|nr:hypothetical protein GPECTOR_71g540 [Gonium pectorale]|eukprot:KXZ44179.1 hypothetical protein GPECTOR_71g540 [Gonium pectorale]